MRIAIIGATGFIGRRLLQELKKHGYECAVITRNRSHAKRLVPDAASFIEWDPPGKGLDSSQLSGLDGVINLAGATVAQRWTTSSKKVIRDSRLETTRLLSDALINCHKPPSVFVSASAVGFYGPNDSAELTEQSSAGSDFLAETCQQWEAQAQRASVAGIRVVNTRIGIVLGAGGGALRSMLTPFKLGLGGPIGVGNQWMSWIHIDDVTGLMIEALANDKLAGPVNLTAPTPETNRTFSRTLGQVLGRPAILPTPVFALKLIFGEFAQILASGQRVLPAEALAVGYHFRFPTLKKALVDIV